MAKKNKKPEPEIDLSASFDEVAAARERVDGGKKRKGKATEPEPEPATRVPDTFYPEMPLDLLDPAVDNPRRDLGDLTELADSIRGPAGIVQPLLVTPRGERWLVVAGHRRRAAAELAGRTTVPVLSRELDERTRRTIMLVENLQRSDLTALEEARTYRALVDELGYTQRQVAADVGRSQSHVAKRLMLLELPEDVRERVDSGGISVGAALEMVKLVDQPKALERVARAAERGAIVEREVERELVEISDQKKLDARVAQLEAEGHRVFVSPQKWCFHAPVGVFKLGRAWNHLPIDPAAHASEPCHALGIWGLDDEPEALCTDRSRHPDVLTPQETRERDNGQGATLAAAEKARVAAERAQDEADDARRRAAILGLVGRKVRRDETLRLVVTGLLRDESLGPADLAAVATPLGLELGPESIDSDEDIDAAFGPWLRAAKAEALLSLTLCLILLHDDTSFRARWARRASAALIDELAAYGYGPSERELAWVRPPEPEADEDDDEGDQGDEDAA